MQSPISRQAAQRISTPRAHYIERVFNPVSQAHGAEDSFERRKGRRTFPSPKPVKEGNPKEAIKLRFGATSQVARRHNNPIVRPISDPARGTDTIVVVRTAIHPRHVASPNRGPANWRRHRRSTLRQRWKWRSPTFPVVTRPRRVVTSPSGPATMPSHGHRQRRCQSGNCSTLLATMKANLWRALP